MQTKLIRRNATRQQAAIFSQIKSARYHDTASQGSKHTTGVKVEDLSDVESFYRAEPYARLNQVSENEYEVCLLNEQTGCAYEWYSFSTKEEAIAPVESPPVEEPTQTTEIPSLDSLTATTTASLDDQLAATEEEYNQAWEEVGKLKAELEEIKFLHQAKINIAQEKVAKISGKLSQLIKKQAIAKSQPTPKLDIVSIELTRVENCDDGQQNRIVTSVWLKANKMLQRWAMTAPTTSHQQCIAKLVFSDGNSLTTPIKLSYWSYSVLKSITDELDPQHEVSWHEITQDNFADYLTTHKLNTKNLALA